MRRVRRLLRLAAHAALFAACLELAARVDDRVVFGAPLWAAYDAERLRETDAEGIRRNVPGARFEKWRINGLGFRGPEVDPVPTAGRLRIACLGQSETFGLYEGEGGEWPRRLERLLQENGLDVEVLNASVVGPGARTRRAYLEKYVLPLRPAIVVLYPSVFDAPAIPRAKAAPAPGPATADVGWSPPASRAWPKLKQRLVAALPGGLVAGVRSWLVDRRLRALEEGTALDGAPAGQVTRLSAQLEELIGLLRARGVSPVLATYPTLVDRENRTRYHAQLASERLWRAQLSELGLIDLAEHANDAIRAVAERTHVPLVETARALPRTDAFFGDHVHYTDAGAEAVARTVKETLVAAGLVDRSLPLKPSQSAPPGTREESRHLGTGIDAGSHAAENSPASPTARGDVWTGRTR